MPMGRGKKKIEIKKREKESERMVTFSKRRQGLFKKARQLHDITHAQIAILVFSPARKPYICGHPDFHHTIEQYNNSNNAATTTTSASEFPKTGEEEEDQDNCELWRSWLATMQLDEYDNVDDLLVLKNNLELLRTNLVQSFFKISF